MKPFIFNIENHMYSIQKILFNKKFLKNDFIPSVSTINKKYGLIKETVGNIDTFDAHLFTRYPGSRETINLNINTIKEYMPPMDQHINIHGYTIEFEHLMDQTLQPCNLANDYLIQHQDIFTNLILSNQLDVITLTKILLIT